MRTGRPFRFLAATFAGWTGLRAFLLWPAMEDAVVEREALEEPTAIAQPASVSVASAASVTASFVPPVAPRGAVVASARTAAQTGPTRAAAPARYTLAVAMPPADSGEPPAEPPRREEKLVTPAPSEAGQASRWSGSAWAIARPSGTGGGLGASQLGGSQAGARLAYALGRAGRVSVVGRLATPLEGRGREAALGLEWRPTRLPIRLFAEQRFALDRGRGGPSAGVIAGLYEQLPLDFRLEAYGQVGAVKRDRVEGFADGVGRMTRAVAKFGPATVDIGAGAWGGAQRRAERLDFGPTIGASVPIAGRNVRLTIDYRVRVAGRARPGSGPALSLGTDF